MGATSPVIAVVDDQESIRRALGRLLRSGGYCVEVFESGERFLKALGVQRIDCVILDLHMPGLDGFDVLLRLGALGASPPVIVLTGHDSAESRRMVEQLGGVSAFLSKTADGQDLLDAIGAAIGANHKDPQP